MHKHKDEPVEPTPEQLLEAKVDAMMDTSAHEDVPGQVQTDKPVNKADAGLPPLDIFTDPKTAPEVPDHLLQQIGAVEEPNKPSDSEEAIKATEPQLDDANTDAAVDDIVAHESEDELEVADTEQPLSEEAEAPAPTKLHHHPLFWTLIFVLALLAIITAYLLASGGNALPGSAGVQDWLQNLHK